MKNSIYKYYLFILVIVLGGFYFINQSKVDDDTLRIMSEKYPEIKQKVNGKKQSWVSQTWKERLPEPPQRLKSVPLSDQRFKYRMDGYNEYLDAFKTVSKIESSSTAGEHLLHVEALFLQYYWAFKQVPVGSENAEICEALLGGNDKYLIFIPHDSSLINLSGELLDYWGTPYYFHPVSEKVMEVRSLGPDKKLWTSDDVFLQ